MELDIVEQRPSCISANHMLSVSDFKSWIAQKCSIEPRDQILMTSRGKHVKLQEIYQEVNFSVPKSLAGWSSLDSRESSLSTIANSLRRTGAKRRGKTYPRPLPRRSLPQRTHQLVLRMRAVLLHGKSSSKIGGHGLSNYRRNAIR